MDREPHPHPGRAEPDHDSKFAQADQQTLFDNLALGIKGVPNYEHFVTMFSKAVKHLSNEFATIETTRTSIIKPIYNDFPRSYTVADFHFKGAEPTDQAYTWLFDVPAVPLNAYLRRYFKAYHRSSYSEWTSIDRDVVMQEKAVIAGPRCLYYRLPKTSHTVEPRGADLRIRGESDRYSYTLQMDFPGPKQTQSKESLQLTSRDGPRNKEAALDHVTWDAYHTYDIDVGEQGNTRTFRNHLVVTFVLQEEAQERQVPAEFHAARRTEASASTTLHNNIG